MTMPTSSLYRGVVTHQRLRPRRHRLSYRLFQILFDLDELGALAGRLSVFSHNRFNLFSFYDADHGDGQGTGLRRYVVGTLESFGVDDRIGRISLLCMPRILGFVFNPLSIFFCYRPDGRLTAMLYEVRNTFGERHSYLIPVESDAAVIRQSCQKAFYVSPFMDMDLRYDFVVSTPGETLNTTINVTNAEGQVMLTAGFAGRRAALTNAALLRLLAAFPLMTLGVVAAIHWEAVLLVFKGLRLRARPPAPTLTVTHVPGSFTKPTSNHPSQ